MLQGWVSAGCLAVNDEEGRKRLCGCSRTSGLRLLRLGGQALWQRVLEGTAQKETLGRSQGCCGDFLSQKMYGRAGKIYVFARKTLQLLSNARGIML